MKTALAALPVLFLAMPASAQPVPYRAIGTEPFWSMTITPATIRLDQPDRAAIVVARPNPRPSFNGHRYVTPRMTVDVTRAPCSDGMSDRRFPDTVAVALGTRTLRGCGGLPIAVPTRRLDATHWTIAAIDDRPVRIDRPTDIRFTDDRIAGTAGCNRFGAKYRLDGNRLTVRPVIATRMACPGPAMQVETRFLRLLDGPVRVSWQGRRTVVLTGPGGSATLVAAR